MTSEATPGEQVIDDRLSCLAHARPPDEWDTPRDLDEDVHAQVVREHATGVGIERLDRVVDALEAPYPERIVRELRKVLQGSDLAEVAASIIGIVDDLGLEPPVPPEPLREINPEDVHLVCWLAVVPG